MIEENQSDPRRADADGLPDTERPGVCRKSDGQRLPRQAGAAEELQRAFAAHGVELTVDEVRERCVAITAKKDGTLDEEALEQVPGGGILTSLAIGAGACAAGYVAGRIVKKKTGYYG